MAYRDPSIKPSEITPESLWSSRKDFLKAAGVLAASLLSPRLAGAKSAFDTTETVTPFETATEYNNFYEFGTDKTDPAKYAGTLKTRPWSVAVEGLVNNPKTYAIEDILKRPSEQRVYRLRCVEGWSAVIPWDGFPLSELLKKAEPKPSAKYAAFTSLMDPKQMPGQKTDVLEWPYVEGLRLDEAMHPLTMVVTGMYGKPLPNQDGAPVRIVIPWKYGFKSIKSLVKIRLTDKRPPTTWNIAKPDEYGFYCNVNPEVDHPRWSQAKERRLGELFRRPTLMFNGYAGQVASLYKGLDLAKNY